ncbi:MAG: DUF1189 domain-containing protein [Legionella sp.]|nr:DUF1189 domain-containing protein [Legionella sp.]
MKSLVSEKHKKNESTRETPHYKARHAFYLAFFSKKLYIDVVRRWRGLGVLYFFILFSVITIPHTIQLMWSLNHVIETNILTPLKSLPVLSIRSGEVVFSEKMPYLIKNNQGEVVSIIDTEGHINQLPESRYPLASILVTKHAMHMDFRLLDFLDTAHKKAFENKAIVIPLDSLGNDEFWVTSWLNKLHITAFKNLLIVMLYPIVVTLNASVFMTILLSMVLVAQLMARIAFKVRLSFLESSRLLFVAATPLAVVCSILVLFDWVIPAPIPGLSKAFAYIALLTLYFSFGVLAYRRSNRMLAVTR